MNLHPKTKHHNLCDEWCRIHWSEWYYLLDEEGISGHMECKSWISTYLLTTFYNKEFQNTVLSNMTKEEYVKYRENLVRITKLDDTFPEVLTHLAEWNVRFDLK